MRSHIGWREEQNIPYKGVETPPSIRVLKPEEKAQIGQYMLASSELERLQMVSKSYTKQCVNEDTEPPKRGEL